jgi:hypothetical protein
MKIIFQSECGDIRFTPVKGDRYEATCPKCGLLISLKAEKSVLMGAAEDHISTGKAAKHLGFSTKKILDWIRKHKFAPTYMINGTRRIKIGEFRRWCATNIKRA